MCGLISVIGKITSKEEKIFKQGLIVDTLRGEHSTGVAVTRRGKHGETFIAKQVGNPFELFNDKRFDKAMSDWNRVLIGHNRYATQGSVNKYNAHPFEFWPVYGAHNGTLNDRAQLEENSRYSVDSQALYNHISVHGLEDAIKKVRGAWALTWWNEEDQTFNVLRNKDRTLFTTKDKDSDVRYFCSEAEMLSLILNRNGVKYDKITSVPEDTWLSFEIGPEGEVSKPRSKIVKGKEAPPPVVHQGGKYPVSTNNNAVRGPVQNPSSQPATQNIKGFDSAVLRKDALMALIERKVDGEDKEYFVVRDVAYPLADVRMYPIVGAKEPLCFKEGDVIVGQIFHFASRPECHYRVSVTNSRMATVHEQVEYDEKEAKLFLDGTLISAKEEKEEPEDKGQTQFYDHRGRLLSKEAWKEAYPNCDWCTQDIDPEEEGTFLSKAGSVLCPSCAKEKEVLQYVHD